MCSMISAQCDELRRIADKDNVSYEASDAMYRAADTILELRDDLQRANAAAQEAEHDESMAWDRVRKAEAENAKLRAERDEWHRVAVSKQDIIDHMRDARAENAKLRELFYEAWGWMQRARYDGSVRDNEMDEIGAKAVKLGIPDYELGIEVK